MRLMTSTVYFHQRLRHFGRRSVGGSAGQVDRRSRSGQWFETHTPSHERCLHVVARRAVEVCRIESPHASPRAPARAARASGASPEREEPRCDELRTLTREYDSGGTRKI